MKRWKQPSRVGAERIARWTERDVTHFAQWITDEVDDVFDDGRVYCDENSDDDSVIDHYIETHIDSAEVRDE